MLAAASLLLVGLAAYALLSGGATPLERARVAVQEGRDLAAYEWLARHVERTEGSPPWEELVECLAGPPGPPDERPRFRDVGPDRGGLYPAGTLTSPTPDFLATPGKRTLRLEVLRTDGTEMTPLVTLELPAGTERRAFPPELPPLPLGSYELQSKDPDGEGGRHAFHVVEPPPDWSQELQRIDASLAVPDLGRLCRAHAMLRAGLKGDA